jgi:hypothetical protein
MPGKLLLLMLIKKLLKKWFMANEAIVFLPVSATSWGEYIFQYKVNNPLFGMK